MFVTMILMTGTTHQIVALTSALWVLSLYPVSLGPVIGVLCVVAVMVGALTPDLDQPTANIWRRVIGGNIVGDVFQAFSGGHRHFTHSLIGIAAISWALRWAAYNLVSPNYVNDALALWAAFMVGYISHPIADTLTDRGVPWLWPLKWSLKVPPGPEQVRVTGNSFVERVIVRSGIIVIAALLVQGNWHIIKGLFL